MLYIMYKMERFSYKSGHAMQFAKHLKKLGYNVTVRILELYTTFNKHYH